MGALQSRPSPLVGEGGSTHSVETDEGAVTPHLTGTNSNTACFTILSHKGRGWAARSEAPQ